MAAEGGPENLLYLLRVISEIIARSDDQSVALAAIVDALAENLKVDVCSVYVYEEASDALVLAATKGLHRDSVGKVRMKPSEGLTGHSFREGELLNLADPASDSRFKFFAETGEERFKSFLSAPLTVGGRRVGILVLQRVRAERFRPAVVDMVTALGTQLAHLILNARMLEALAGASTAGAGAVADGRREPGQVMLRGNAANQGIAIGRVVIFKPVDFIEHIEHGSHAGAELELELLARAFALTKEKTIDLEKRALTLISEADASIFNVHLLLLEDRSFVEKITAEVTREGHTLEFGIARVFKEYEKRFLALGDRTFRDRSMDLKDVSLRLIETIRELRAGTEHAGGHIPPLDGTRCVLVAKELLPSDLVRMPAGAVVGIVCEKGGVTAHVAILAKALDIPALMGVKGVTEIAAAGDECIVDCHAEVAYVRPNELVRTRFHELAAAREFAAAPADKGPAVTRDGQALILRANIALVCETPLLAAYGAQGIGLYRTEFLFMVRDYLPSEEDQYRIFAKIVAAARGEDVTIRALDIGGDKPVPSIAFPHEDNPALGNRGLRFLLSRPDVLRPHLRAILRAGAGGRLKILFPMVASREEVVQVRAVLDALTLELDAARVPRAASYKVGIMLEVPSAVFALDRLIGAVDYMSVGSNDLMQYTFAADRTNEAVAGPHQNLHPEFLRLLAAIARTFRTHPEKELALCGEMAGNVLAVPFLIGAGFRDLSMPPKRIPVVRRVIGAFSASECEALVAEAVELATPEAVASLITAALADRGLEKGD
jgi:phosphotransferase system enzyme I (PtsP)